MSGNLILTFLGGKRLQNTIPATAGNVVTYLSPESSKRWVILHGILTLVNDATVADRVVLFQLTDGSNLTLEIGRSTSWTASQSKNIELKETVGLNTALIVAEAIAIGTQTILEGADQLKITVLNGVAGDSYSGYIIVLEI